MADDVLVKVGADISSYSKEMSKASKELGSFTERNSKTFDAFKKTGAAVTGAGVALSAGLGYAVKTAADFESGMSEVAAISGATADEFDALEKRARELGGSTSFSAKEASEGLSFLALAGWDTKQMIDGLEPVLHLAEAGALDLGRSADLVTDSMAGLGVGVDELDGYLDKVAQTSRESNTDIDALMEAFVIAGGTFDRLNIPLEESNAFLGILANRGFKGAEAGTAVNAIMARLTQTTGPAADALNEMGVTAFDSEGNFRGMEVVLKDVEAAMSTMTDAEKAHYQQQLAGLNHGKTFSAMINGLGDEYDDLKESIINSDGALLEMRNTMKDNLQGALENLSSAFEEIMISIGTALLPAVKVLTGWLQKLANWFNSLSKTTKSIIAIIAAIAAAFALIVGPLLLLVGFIPTIIAGFVALKAVFVAVTAAILSPITLIIAGIAALIAAVIWAYNQFEWFRDAVLAVWEWIEISVLAVFDVIKEAISMALEFIMSIWEEHGESLLNIVTTIWDGIKDAIDAVISFIQEIVENILGKVSEFWEEHGEFITKVTEKVWDTIKQVVKLSLDVIREYISVVLNAIKSIFEVVWPVISGVVKTAWELIKTIVKNALETVSGIINTVMNLIKGNWKGAWNSIKETAANIMNNIIDLFKGIDLYQIGKDVIDGLINGIKSMVGKVSDAVKSVTSKITGTVKKILGIKSPSRVLAEIGRWTGEGLVVGIEGMTNNVAKAADGLALAAIPDERQIDLSYATPTGIQSSLSSAINGTVDVNSREDLIAGAIANLERRLDGMQVVMEGETVGRIVAPTVSETINEGKNNAIRNGGRRRL